MGEFLMLKIEEIIIPEDQKLRIVQDDDRIEELARTIAQHGLLQPPVVRMTGKGFELRAGCRRVLACKRLGMTEITCHVLEVDEGEGKFITLTENIARRDLSIIEEACAIREILEKGVADVDQIAQQLGRSRGWVDRRLEVLGWPGDVQEMVHNGKISAAAGAQLAKIADDEARKGLLHHAAEHGISAKTASLWVQQNARVENVSGTQIYAPDTHASGAEEFVVKIKCFCCTEEYTIEEVQRIAMCGSCLRQLGSLLGGEANERDESLVDKR